MITANKTPFEQAAAYLTPFRKELAELPRSFTDTVSEIRLRAGQPVTLESSQNRKRLEKLVTVGQIAECVREFCGQSVHSYEKQFREGWLTLKGGHRAGFTGTAVLDSHGRVTAVKDVSSVNVRIARQYKGSADELFAAFTSFDTQGLLMIGKPLSAKTTVLRDLCRQLSRTSKVALIDERSEIAAVYKGTPTLDVGENTDVLDVFPKGEGIMAAMRNLSPEYLLCDEIGYEVREVAALANAGIKLILTAHAGSIEEARKSERITALLQSGGITHIALFGSDNNIGRLQRYERVHEFSANSANSANSGNSRGNRGGSGGGGGGRVFFSAPQKAGGNPPRFDANALRNVNPDSPQTT